MSRKADAQATLDRWDGGDVWGGWSPNVRFDKVWPFGWVAVWTGPRGGKYRMWHLTRRGAQRRVQAELARWTRERQRRGVHRIKGQDILR